ncbi:MAG: hypothetical protein FVQ79_00435 [Planctomycetes bacterium]|nr:hypothetical protein [Planctomycetota bacterium]
MIFPEKYSSHHHCKERPIEYRLERECWICISHAKNSSGYPIITRERLDFTIKRSHLHRYTYYLSNGSFPNESLILHKCNRKDCINPDHLYLGSRSDNMLDRVRSEKPYKNKRKFNRIVQ